RLFFTIPPSPSSPLFPYTTLFRSPRHIRPHATYAICRRVEGRQHLLRPDAMLNALFIWVLGVTAPRLGIEVHVATVMSTHFHMRSEEHTSELQSRENIVCRLLLEK